VRVLFVCLGNICRSPTAEGVMRQMVSEAGLADRVQIDSAGTGGWHVGHPPDSRAAAAAAARGIALSGGARRFAPEDFERFDLILAMDRDNRSDLLRLAPDERSRARVRMLREFDPAFSAGGDVDVPDPYNGDADAFDEVLDLVCAACRGLLDHVRSIVRA
jgi:protein-tyrosine phosphatase